MTVPKSQNYGNRSGSDPRNQSEADRRAYETRLFGSTWH
nr:MAG TPA: hypothetical protein [Caudoviricetes sp.]